MRDLVLVLGGSSLIVGCAAGSMMIKGPVQQQCAGYGLKGCPELVDGVVLYLDGKEALARDKLKQAVAQNSPEQIRPFAKALKEVVPGETGSEIAALLAGEVDVTIAANVAPPGPPVSASVAPTRAPTASVVASVSSPDDAGGDGEAVVVESTRLAPKGAEPLLLALAAPLDPNRLLTESVMPLRETNRGACEVIGKPGVCAPRQPGPVVLTDVVTAGGCPVELYVGAADATGALRWTIPVAAVGAHGGRFFVRGDERVMVAARGGTLTQAGDVRCVVTWSGFRPRIVPLMAGTNSATLSP